MHYEGNYQQLDSVKARFFWQGNEKKKRMYHMVSGKVSQTQRFWWTGDWGSLM